MKRVFKTILLAIVAIAAIVWACSYSVTGLAWLVSTPSVQLGSLLI